MKRNRCQTVEDKRDFVIDRPKIGERVKKQTKEKNRGYWDHQAIRFHCALKVQRYNCAETTMWINAHYAMGQKIQGEIGHIQKTLHSYKTGKCVSSCTDRRFREAYFQEHNQEADHLADLDAEGKRNITIEKRQYRKLEGSSRWLGWQHKDRWTKWMRCCDRRYGPGQVDHNQ